MSTSNGQIGKNIITEYPEEGRLRKELQNRHDPESERIKRYLAMPDLSRTEGSPLKALIDDVNQSLNLRVLIISKSRKSCPQTSVSTCLVSRRTIRPAAAQIPIMWTMKIFYAHTIR